MLTPWFVRPHPLLRPRPLPSLSLQENLQLLSIEGNDQLVMSRNHHYGGQVCPRRKLFFVVLRSFFPLLLLHVVAFGGLARPFEMMALWPVLNYGGWVVAECSVRSGPCCSPTCASPRANLVSLGVLSSPSPWRWPSVFSLWLTFVSPWDMVLPTPGVTGTGMFFHGADDVRDKRIIVYHVGGRRRGNGVAHRRALGGRGRGDFFCVCLLLRVWIVASLASCFVCRRVESSTTFRFAPGSCAQEASCPLLLGAF